jgi:hypothetical protein
MSRLLRQRNVSLLGLLAACAVVPGAVLHFFGETEVAIAGSVHFLPIAVSAGLAAAAAAALTVAGARRGDARSVVIGTAFSSMAALLSIHGVMTPGFLVGDNGLVAFSGAATLPVGAAVLALAAIPELRRPSASGSTAPAIRAAWALPTSTSRHASWPSATCSTRSSRTASIATRGGWRTPST